MSDSDNVLYWIYGPIISDKRIKLLSETRLCKSRELCQRGSSMSQPCSIHHEFAVTQYTPWACAQWSESGHNADKQLAVLGSRCVTLWLWYGQFEVWLLQPIQLLWGAWIYWVVQVLVSRDKDLCHVYQNCWHYRADMECGTYGRTVRQTDGVKPIDPQQLRGAGV